MGSTAVPPTSLRITMGMLVTGSITRPRIFISTSMRPLQLSGHRPIGSSGHLATKQVGLLMARWPGLSCLDSFTNQAIRSRRSHPHLPVTTYIRGFTGKVEDPIAGGSAHGLAQARLVAFHENFERLPHQRLVAPQLNLALRFLQPRQTAAFLF